MSSRGKKTGAPVQRARSAHNRQRQRLIDACISALHIHGPSRTTVEKVVAIAKMSPGIVRFYFDSKAALLVASLQFLAAEFEEQLLVPVSKLKSNPVAALELLVDLYLDPEIASPRKVSVWYSFWGEASSRQEYYDICGQKDESFAALVRELIGRLIEASGQHQLDADGVALGLIGVLEMLWQDFAFRSEDAIDRRAARRRAMAYLKSIFPGQFVPRRGAPGRRAAARRRAALCGLGLRPRARVRPGASRTPSRRGKRPHTSPSLPRAGDFVTADLGVERVLLIRDSYGAIQALRNSCPEVPHALVTARRGRIEDHIDCPVHGLKFDRSGRSAGGAHAGLEPLDLHTAGGFLLVRSAAGAAHAAPLWPERRARAPLRALAPAPDIEVQANWKLLVELWLASADARRTERRGRAAQLGLASRGRAGLERRALPPPRRRRGRRALAPAIRGAESIAAVASGRRDAAAGDRSGARTLPHAAHSPHASHVGARSGGRAIPLGAAH